MKYTHQSIPEIKNPRKKKLHIVYLVHIKAEWFNYVEIRGEDRVSRCDLLWGLPRRRSRRAFSGEEGVEEGGYTLLGPATYLSPRHHYPFFFPYPYWPLYRLFSISLASSFFLTILVFLLPLLTFFRFPSRLSPFLLSLYISPSFLSSTSFPLFLPFYFFPLSPFTVSFTLISTTLTTTS